MRRTGLRPPPTPEGGGVCQGAEQQGGEELQVWTRGRESVATMYAQVTAAAASNPTLRHGRHTHTQPHVSTTNAPNGPHTCMAACMAPTPPAPTATHRPGSTVSQHDQSRTSPHGAPYR